MTYCLQAGFPKSGNYLLHTILREILEQAGRFSSYRAGCALPSDMDRYITTHRGIEADCIRIENGQPRLIIPHPDIGSMPIDHLASFLDRAAIVWTHQQFSEALIRHFAQVPCWLYIIRDGRDAITSLFHYVVSPIVRRRNPHYRITDVLELFQEYDYFARHVANWRDHVQAWANCPHPVTWLSFEKLITEKTAVLKTICDAVGFPADLQRLLATTDPARMSRQSPTHVRRGVQGDWRHHFNRKHREIFKEIAGKTLIETGYENDFDW